MKDYRKQQQRNGYAMIASGLALGIMSLIGDVPGPWDDAALVTSYLGCFGTCANSIRLSLLQRRQKKSMKGN